MSRDYKFDIGFKSSKQYPCGMKAVCGAIERKKKGAGHSEDYYNKTLLVTKCTNISGWGIKAKSELSSF